MGRLTTHVLDTAHGQPAANIKIDLFKLNHEQRQLCLSIITNKDGRAPAPLLEGDEFVQGEYELVFHAGDYFKTRGLDLSQPAFLDLIVIRFNISAPNEHYHVPLLVSPYGYSTYRGS